MMNYHHKYQKKGQYLLHPGLIEYKRGGWKFQMQFNGILLLILGLLSLYPTFLMSFDFTMTILVVGFWLFGKAIMLKGKLPFPTYYRRDYQNDNFLFVCKMILHGAIVRSVAILGYFTFRLVLAQGDAFEMKGVVADMMHVLFNPLPQALAIAIFLFLFYYMFQKEKYMSIEGFSREVMQIIRARNISINEAVRQFIFVRDKALDMQLLDGVKYEYREEQTSEMVKENRPKENNIQSFPNPEPTQPLRRQSRR